MTHYSIMESLFFLCLLVYAAPTEKTALNERELFKDKWDVKYPKIY